jgi:hypothetical protein
LLEDALDKMLDAGALAPEDRDAAATPAWAAVHGLSQLLLGPMAGLRPAERAALIEAPEPRRARADRPGLTVASG